MHCIAGMLLLHIFVLQKSFEKKIVICQYYFFGITEFKLKFYLCRHVISLNRLRHIGFVKLLGTHSKIKATKVLMRIICTSHGPQIGGE